MALIAYAPNTDFLNLLDKNKIYLSHLRLGASSSWIAGLEKIVFDDSTFLEPYSILYNKTLYTSLAFSYAWTPFPSLKIKIGRYCSIAEGVSIMPPTHPLTAATTSPLAFIPDSLSVFRDYWKDSGLDRSLLSEQTHKNDHGFVTIGHDVYIGKDAVLSPGVKIGTGAVVGMRSIVTKDVEPYSVVAGVPAEVKKRRFDKSVSALLLESKWYNYEFSKLARIGVDNPAAMAEYILSSRKEMSEYLLPRPISLSALCIEAGCPRL